MFDFYIFAKMGSKVTLLIGHGHLSGGGGGGGEQNLTDYWMKTALFGKWDRMGFRKIIGKITKNYILVSDFCVGANWLNLIISADG